MKKVRRNGRNPRKTNAHGVWFVSTTKPTWHELGSNQLQAPEIGGTKPPRSQSRVCHIQLCGSND